MNSRATLSDQDQRTKIIEELDKNMMVEAAAGTGKTTCLIKRMINLLKYNHCNVRNMAAITFTRKAKAELRNRFQIDLEKAVFESKGTEKELLRSALLNIEKCFIGTIHSFCAKLLTERPIEAGISLSFKEIEPEEDFIIRKKAWEEYLLNIKADEKNSTLDDCEKLGIEINDLDDVFLFFTEYPDVEIWPGENKQLPLPNLSPVINKIEEYACHMSRLLHNKRLEWRKDKFLSFYKEFPVVFPDFNIENLKEVYKMICLFDRKAATVQKEWIKDGIFTKKECKEEQNRWDNFRKEIIEPVIRRWRECRYSLVIKIMKQAQKIYNFRRWNNGKLNYQDLLIKAANLLRENPHVRIYFQNRFTHLLVDEFQDTDPIQAQVMMYLTNADPYEKNWKRCIPKPGSLFVVGDPKQSIYRFRRADIVTYNEVKNIICKTAENKDEGILIKLSTNFRSSLKIIEWINKAFMNEFPEATTSESPTYVPLVQGRFQDCSAENDGVFRITVPAEHCRNGIKAATYEAELISRYIKSELDNKAGAVPSDFMIITKGRKHLNIYAENLKKYRIPFCITGGTTLNEMQELKLLYLCLKSILEPDNPVALVGVLRSELFGISDAKLYEFKKAGGSFSFLTSIPDNLKKSTESAFLSAFTNLKYLHKLFSKIPPLSALEKMIRQLGFMLISCNKEDQKMRAGGLAKVIEILRTYRDSFFSPSEVLLFLNKLTKGELKFDSKRIFAQEEDAVRIMNLHQAKGLEARIVFLSDPSGESDHDVFLHIDRRGDRICGYLSVHNRKSNKPTILSQAESWGHFAAKEKAFLSAESLRLRYVAATRAKDRLIIVRKEKGASRNPWAFFEPYLSIFPELKDPGEQKVYERPGVRITEHDFHKANEAIRSKLNNSKKKTYDVRQAKEYALKDYYSSTEILEKQLSDIDAIPEITIKQVFSEIESVPGEYGVEWGEVLHKFFEIILKNDSVDLYSLAYDLACEYNLDLTLINLMIDVTRSVRKSEIWNRAISSSSFFTEIPFQVLSEGGNNLTVPTIVRGVIDLVFKEKDGWVIVDYKTDVIKNKESMYKLIDLYRRQLKLYADNWKCAVGEEVKEMGLYFTSINSYITI